MRDVVIFGCGGLGQYVCDLFAQGDAYRPIAFLDSDPRTHGLEIDGLVVQGGLDAASALARRGAAFVVAIGENAARTRVGEALRRRRLALASAIHPLASVASSARLGEPVIIGPRAIVCVNARVADFALLGPGAIVDHDSIVDYGAHVEAAARLAGGVVVEPLATIGVGASVIPGRRVGCGARVLGGAAVVRDVRPGGCVGGMPARPVALNVVTAPAGARVRPGELTPSPAPLVSFT